MRIEANNPNPKMPMVRYIGGTWRVGGLLALSRAFGDAYLKGSLQFEGVGAASGGKRAPSVWEPYIAADPGRIADRTDASVGAGFYARWRSDVALLRVLKVPARKGAAAAEWRCGRTSGSTCRRLVPGCCALPSPVVD